MLICYVVCVLLWWQCNVMINYDVDMLCVVVSVLCWLLTRAHSPPRCALLEAFSHVTLHQALQLDLGRAQQWSTHDLVGTRRRPTWVGVGGRHGSVLVVGGG